MSALKAVNPRPPMTRMRRQIGKSTGAAARIGRVMNGASSATTPTQRRAVSAIGEMWPAARRLATALPAQASVVSVRRR